MPGGAGGNADEIGQPNGVPGGVGLGQGSQSTEVPDVTYVPVGDVRPAMVLQRVEPQYPRIALLNRIGGVVKIGCVIDKEGRLRDPQIVESSFGAFERPALEAVMQWRFAAGTLHGKPVDTWFELTVYFRVK